MAAVMSGGGATSYLSQMVRKMGVKVTLLMVLLSVGGARAEAPTVMGVQLFVNNTPTEVLDVTEKEAIVVSFQLDALPEDASVEVVVQENSADSFGHVKIWPNRFALKEMAGDLTETFNLTGTFLGFSKLQFLLVAPDGKLRALSNETDIMVQRADKLHDQIFTVTMIILVGIAYINMGCAIDLEIIKRTLKRPVAPVIGLASQYLFMPLTSYTLGYFLFHDSPALWLGLFIIGCSPGGGGSNIWTHVLGGSLDLSVTMTFVSTVVAFGALPMWVYILASTIFQDGNFDYIPYSKMAVMVVGLVLPCAIGVALKKFLPKVAGVLKKLLTPVAVVFIIFASTFGVYVNFYIFYYFTWKVAIVGMALPWLGFLFGAVMAVLCKRQFEEVIAVSIETGIQNTGLAIGVVKFALQKFSPLGDITVVVPVAVATLTPIPLLLALLCKRLYERRRKSKLEGIDGPCENPEDPTASPSSSNLKMTPANSQTPLSRDLKK
ncbi:ileal sodium/bile acid cotransporter [Penaeus vannamei]|uniref:P3 protein n=1 Tax=Penaeus vannamei TaxID=6689 RepID=A0A3R7LYD7_PENVA|nr:ileal sodium/bile acid cotransporter-like [Penaeus vannamei]XP_027224756.1 ileal sodium/bile acid cotransporter-like [Penaeus vannamei]XP_027224759.1 ileal sodium/bile acid cotransporter-like [Penaeus vannamei]ROT67889.1 P3 protein [Penaeus vannamei]